MNRSLRWCFGFVVLLLGADGLRSQAPRADTGGSSESAAQQPPAQGGAKSTHPTAAPFVLRTETRLVQLNVVVEDRKGKAVTGLTKGDFTLLDNGKVQEITLFASETAVPAAATNDTATNEGHNAGVLAPNVFGNRLRHADELPGSVTVILFDALNTSFTDQAYARTQILAFLRQLQPQDHVAIYLLTNRLSVINEFTQDSKSLLLAIQMFETFPSLLLKNSSQPMASPDDFGGKQKEAAHLAEMMNDMNSKLSDLSDARRVDITSRAIEAIANHVAGIPGRKSLVWVSGGFPISISFTSNDTSPLDSQSQNFTPQMERVARALNQSNMAIYPVDARGILVNGEFDASAGHPFSAHGPATETGVGQSELLTMETLAQRTGGHAYYYTNDIKGAIRRTLADAQYTYVIGYYPDHGTWDGAYHTLTLRTKKKSNAVLRYRKGYFALADPPENQEVTHNALQAAIWSPVDATSLGIQARIQAIYTATHKLDLRVKVDMGDLRLKDADGRRAGKIDAIYLQLGAGDAVKAVEPRSYSVDMSEAEYQAMLGGGYELKAALKIEDGTRNLRVVVRDAGSGLLGSVTVPLQEFMPTQSAVN